MSSSGIALDLAPRYLRGYRKPRCPVRHVAWYLTDYTPTVLESALAHHFTSGLF